MTGARTPAVSTLVVAVAVIAGLWGIGLLVEMTGWATVVSVAIVVTGLAAMAARRITRSRLLPTAASLVAGTLISLPLFATTSEGQRHMWPTPTAFRDWWATLEAGAIQATNSRPPVEASAEIIALIAAGSVLLFIVTDLIAVTARAAAMAGLLLVLPWIPAVLFQVMVPLPALMVSVAAWVALLSLGRRNTPGGVAPSLGAVGMSAAAVVALTLMVAPTAINGNGWGMLPQLFESDSNDLSTRLNLELDLRNSLTTRSQATVMSYTTLGPQPDVWRLYTLTEFDGTGWQRDDSSNGPRSASGSVLWPVSVDGWAQRERQRIDIQINTLTENSLPVPGVPRSVEVPGEWTYEPTRDEVLSQTATTQGMRYSVVSAVDFHRATALRNSQALIDSSTGDITDPALLQLAPGIDVDRIGGLANQIVGSATTRYDQVVALQDYLRDPTLFTYDVTVAPSEGDAVSVFLDTRVGYCVQFATTMVVMARALDIPARLAVGFLPGDRVGDNSYTVTGSEAHAWPEIFFPGHGWVRFEPTPAVQTGAAPQWTNPYPFYIPVPREVLDGANPVPPPPVVIPDDPLGPNPDTVPEPSVTAVQWWMLAVIVVLLAPLAWWLRRRRVRLIAESRIDPNLVFNDLLRRLPPDVRWPAAATPLEAYALLLTAVERRGTSLDEDALKAWDRVIAAVSDYRYAPEGTSHPVGRIEMWCDTVADAIPELDTEVRARSRLARVGARSGPQRDA